MRNVLSVIRGKQAALREQLALLDEMEKLIIQGHLPKVPTYTFPSETRLGHLHHAQLIDDQWRCTCEGFQYRGVCKHVRHVESDVKLERMRQELRVASGVRN